MRKHLRDGQWQALSLPCTAPGRLRTAEQILHSHCRSLPAPWEDSPVSQRRCAIITLAPHLAPPATLSSPLPPPFTTNHFTSLPPRLLQQSLGRDRLTQRGECKSSHIPRHPRCRRNSHPHQAPHPPRLQYSRLHYSPPPPSSREAMLRYPRAWEAVPRKSAAPLLSEEDSLPLLPLSPTASAALAKVPEDTSYSQSSIDYRSSLLS